MSTTHNAVRELRNPIISDTTADTLFQVGCCLSFVSRLHEDMSDWQVLAGTSGVGGPDGMSFEQHRGLSLLTACVHQAVMYEMERVDNAASA